MKTRKNISMEDALIEKAENKAKKLGFTFSGYMTYLVNKDLNGEVEIKAPVKINKVSNAIDNILDY